MGCQIAIREDCILKIKRCFFSGSFRRPKFDGDEIITVKVLKHSYGPTTDQHTFTLLCTESADGNRTNVGDKILMKGRNLYPAVLDIIYQSEESKQASHY